MLRYRHIAYLIGVHYVANSINGRAIIRFSFVMGSPDKSLLEIIVEIFRRTGEYQGPDFSLFLSLHLRNVEYIFDYKLIVVTFSFQTIFLHSLFTTLLV